MECERMRGGVLWPLSVSLQVSEREDSVLPRCEGAVTGAGMGEK